MNLLLYREFQNFFLRKWHLILYELNLKYSTKWEKSVKETLTQRCSAINTDVEYIYNMKENRLLAILQYVRILVFLFSTKHCQVF